MEHLKKNTAQVVKFDNAEAGNISFINKDPQNPILKLCANGDIFVKGKLIENDIEVINALKEFIAGQRKIKSINVDKLNGKIFEALGEASMCWTETPKGTFQSSKVLEIGNKLSDDIINLINQ